MKKQSFVAALLAVVGILPINAQVVFDEYFTHKTMRLDYYHAGDAKSEHFFVDEVIEEPYWAGIWSTSAPWVTISSK